MPPFQVHATGTMNDSHHGTDPMVGSPRRGLRRWSGQNTAASRSVSCRTLQTESKKEEQPQRRHKVSRQRSSSLSSATRDKKPSFTSLRAAYLDAMKNSNERGIFSRAEEAQVGPIEEEKLVPPKPSARPVYPRSQSLMHLESSAPVEKKKKSWVQKTTVIEEEEGPKKGRPGVQRTRSKSLTRMNDTSVQRQLQNRRGSWIKNEKGQFVKAKSMWNVTATPEEEQPTTRKETPVVPWEAQTNRRGSWIRDGKGGFIRAGIPTDDDNSSTAKEEKKTDAAVGVHSQDRRSSWVSKGKAIYAQSERNVLYETKKKSETFLNKKTKPLVKPTTPEQQPNNRRTFWVSKGKAIYTQSERNISTSSKKAPWEKHGDSWAKPNASASCVNLPSPIRPIPEEPISATIPSEPTDTGFRKLLHPRKVVQRTRSRSLTSLRQKKAPDGTIQSTLDYTESVVWKPRKDKAATKIQAMVRRCLAQRDWITKKPWLEKRRINLQKERELAKIEREKESAKLEFKYRLQDEEESQEKLVQKLEKEKAELEKEIKLQEDILWSLRLDLQKESDESFRLAERRRTDAIVNQLNATTQASFDEDRKIAKKRRKAVKKEIKAVKQELEEIQESWDEEKEQKQKIVDCMKAILRQVLKSEDEQDQGLADFLARYHGVDV